MLVTNGNNKRKALFVGFLIFVSKWLREKQKWHILYSAHINISTVDGDKIGSMERLIKGLFRAEYGCPKCGKEKPIYFGGVPE